jgi:hypothetical protein
MLQRGFSIREISLFTKWTDDEIKKLKEVVVNEKFEPVLELEYPIELHSESQQLKVGDGLVKGELLHGTFDGYANGLLLSLLLSSLSLFLLLLSLSSSPSPSLSPSLSLSPPSLLSLSPLSSSSPPSSSSNDEAKR